MPKLRYVGMCLLAVVCLAACTDVLMTGAQVVYNRRNIEKNVTDQYLTRQAYRALKFDTHEFKESNIAVATYNGEMLLTGQVPHEDLKIKAEEIVREQTKVKRIFNLLTIANPSSALTRIGDSWITAKVKGKLLASNDLDASSIKVVTENGTVYLMGILFPADADKAVEIARTTQGVLQVVKIFSYLKISKS